MPKSTCSFPECNRKVHGYELCSSHYRQKYIEGVELAPIKASVKGTMTLEERFWHFTTKTTGCWTWNSSHVSSGYGVLSYKGRQLRAHRVAYELLVGPIPDTLVLDHLCKNRGCVNPAHLEVVTLGENTLRGDGPSGRNLRKTHCKRDHEFTAENTYVTKNGGRACKQCGREKSLRLYYAKKNRDK